MGGEASGAGAGVGEAEGANDKSPANSNVDTPPRTVKELLHKIISDPGYGILSECGSAIATPAMTAWNGEAKQRGMPTIKHKRGEGLPEGLCVSMPPDLSGRMAQEYHRLDAMARELLITEDHPLASVPFKKLNTQYSVLKGDEAINARVRVAKLLTPQTLEFLHAKQDPEQPNIEVMQQLYDAGFRRDPISQMPLFNPRAVSPEFQADFWKMYCGITDGINAKEGCEETCRHMDRVKEHLQTHCSGIDQADVDAANLGELPNLGEAEKGPQQTTLF